MTKYFFIIFIIWSYSSFGQSTTLDFLAPVPFSYDADYLTYLNSISGNLTEQEKLNENNFIVALKNAGLWTRMKTGYFMFTGNKATTKVNIKNPATYPLTEVNTVVFDAGRGISSDRYSSYMNQPFKSNEYSGIETDLTFIQYIPDDNTEAQLSFSNGMRMNSAGTAFMAMYPFGDTQGYKYHSTLSSAITGANHNGLYGVTYDGTNVVGYKDANKYSSAATPIVPNLSINRFILSLNNSTSNGGSVPQSYYSRSVAIDFIFDRFNDTDWANFRSAFNTYLLPLLNKNRIENFAHCWFARNRALYHSGSNKTFFGGVYGPSNANYSQYIFQLDHATGEITNFRLGTATQKDDHDEPSIIIRSSDSRLVAMYTEHGGASIRWRVSNNPLDISSWGSEQTFDPNGGRVCTYPSIFQVSNGDMYGFYRDCLTTGEGSCRWSYIKSTDNAATFSGNVPYSDFTYSAAYQDPTNANKIHYVVTEHPADGDNPNYVCSFYFDASDATFHKTDGTNVTANIPLQAANTSILQTNSLPVQCWLEDIIVDATGKPRVLFNLIPDEPTSLTKDEYYTEWNGTSWTTPLLLHRSASHLMETDLPAAQDIDSRWYAPLGSFDRGNPDRIFSSKEVNGVCEIHKLTRLSSSSFTSEQLTFNSGYDQWRPFTTSAPNRNVFWLNKRYYDDWLNLFCEDLRYDTF